MVGREVVLRVTKEARPPGEVVLDVRGLQVMDRLGLPAVRDVSFTVRAGEITGIAGVDGNGQVELEEALAGVRPVQAGSLTLAGRDLTEGSVRRRIEAGMGHIPQDRQRDGLVLEFSLTENMLLGSQWRRPYARLVGLDYQAVKAAARRGIREFSVKTPGEASRADTLSGGNQQKLILAREIGRNPVFLLAAQPTRGLDVGAIEFVHGQLLGLRQRGVAILLISYELDEILALADRILVLFEGRLVLETAGEEAERAKLGLAMTGGHSRNAYRGADKAEREVPAGDSYDS
jgi:simple sugar transport system ATP-binding protein